MKKQYQIRQAQSSDASAICELLHQSIRRLCFDDHHNDENVLSQWLGNKTTENMVKWVSLEDIFTIVCVNQSRIIGVGSMGADGDIHLCYVSPDWIAAGVGNMLLIAMLDIAKSLNISQVRLVSTQTAKTFYEHHGFKCTDKPEWGFGILGYPMSRSVDG